MALGPQLEVMEAEWVFVGAPGRTLLDFGRLKQQVEKQKRVLESCNLRWETGTVDGCEAPDIFQETVFRLDSGSETPSVLAAVRLGSGFKTLFRPTVPYLGRGCEVWRL